MLDFIITMLIASPIFYLLYKGKRLARWWDEKNRKANIELQIMRGQRDGRLLNEVAQDMRDQGRL